MWGKGTGRVSQRSRLKKGVSVRGGAKVCVCVCECVRECGGLCGEVIA